MRIRENRISGILSVFRNPAALLILIVWAWEGAGVLGPVQAQSAPRPVYIDGEGVIRWRDNQEELALFGVNYCLPSGYSYRAAAQTGKDLKQAVDADMAHLARLGLSAVRLSFWGDWENSDREGNLIDNEHLDLLDYVIARASERGLYLMLTPITLYSPVWPLPEEMNTCRGFPRFYPKNELGINPQAIRVQQKYLEGILNHVNRYTGTAYKDDLSIVLIEPVNEPQHHPDKNPSAYINALTEAIRGTGYQRPIVFNVSQDMAIAPAVRDSLVDGASFGWYPSGLLNGFTLECNFLPRVDSYRPMLDPTLKGKPKVVYEFDGGDIAGSYLYPAMARTFRSAGVQLAFMFSYDPLVLASENLEYQTHCLNLAYTPGKAISLMIAAEIFGRLPRFQSFGRYPASNQFGPVRVSHSENLSELTTDREFFYSNNTQTLPPKPDLLERIVGCGSSSAVKYEGTGAYFLEKLAAGAWRLEVYPDAVWTYDPFGRPSRGRQAACLFRRQRRMKITLPDPGPEFTLTAIDQGNLYRTHAVEGEFTIVPGVYLLTKEGVVFDRLSAFSFGPLKLDEYIVWATESTPVSVRYRPPRQIVEGRAFPVEAQVASEKEPEEVILSYRSGKEKPFAQISMKKKAAYQYAAEIPSDQIRAGVMDYAVSVRLDDEILTFPSQVTGLPIQGQSAESKSTVIYDAAFSPAKAELKQWFTQNASAEIVKNNDQESVLRIRTGGFEPNGSVVVDLAVDFNESPVRLPLFEKERYEDVVFILKGRSLIPETGQVQATLTDRYNMTQTQHLSLDSRGDCRIIFRDFCIANLRSVRLAIGAWLFPGQEGLAHGFEVRQIILQPSPALWSVPVAAAEAPFVLFDAAVDSDRLIFPNSEHKVRFTKRRVLGSTSGAAALRVEAPTFKPSPQDVSFRLIYGGSIETCREDLSGYNAVRLRARSGARETTCMELDLIQRNGSVRGALVPLTADWQTIEIPLMDFQPTVATWLPRSYPTIGFDYWDQGQKTDSRPLDLKDLEAVQISMGARFFPEFTDTRHAVEIEEIQLAKKSDVR
jgi:hypothetical protein